jgi:hypothetical protein
MTFFYFMLIVFLGLVEGRVSLVYMYNLKDNCSTWRGDIFYTDLSKTKRQKTTLLRIL